MHFLNILRRWLPKRRKKRSTTLISSPVEATIKTTSQTPLTIKADEQSGLGQVVPQAKEVTLTVRYQDPQGRQLHPPLTLTGSKGATVKFPWLKIVGYRLVSVAHLQLKFTEPTMITLIYQPQMAAPVLVFHRDVEGQLLTKPQLLRGYLNDHYQAQPLTGGLNFVQKTPENQTGQFKTTTQTVHYQYDPLNLNYDWHSTLGFIQLDRACFVYQQPDEEQPPLLQLPATAVWRVFGTAISLGGTKWFWLGGQFWIKPTHYQVRHNNPLVPTPFIVSKQFLVHYTVIKSEAIQLSAEIASTSITQWQAPYEAPTQSDLRLNEKITLNQLQVLDNGSQWYLQTNGTWLMKTALKNIQKQTVTEVV